VSKFLKRGVRVSNASETREIRSSLPQPEALEAIEMSGLKRASWNTRFIDAQRLTLKRRG
jgi:hypothetical protein